MVRQHNSDMKDNSEFWQNSQQSTSLQDRNEYRESYQNDLWQEENPISDMKDNSELWQNSQQSTSLQDRNEYRESHQNDLWQEGNPRLEATDMSDNPDFNTFDEDLPDSVNLKDNIEQDFWENRDGDPSPPPRVNSELSIIANDDDTTVASDVLDNDQTETHFYVDDDVREEEEEEEDNCVNNNEMCSQSPNMSRTNSSAKSMVTAKQRSKEETSLSNTEFKLNLDDDISQLIDNDEDALTDDYSSLRSPRVNYLTNQPSGSHSSYLRRQRLTAASTLDIPVSGWRGEKGEFV